MACHLNKKHKEQKRSFAKTSKDREKQMLDHLMFKKKRIWDTPAPNVTLHSDIMLRFIGLATLWSIWWSEKCVIGMP